MPEQIKSFADPDSSLDFDAYAKLEDEYARKKLNAAMVLEVFLNGNNFTFSEDGKPRSVVPHIGSITYYYVNAHKLVKIEGQNITVTISYNNDRYDASFVVNFSTKLVLSQAEIEFIYEKTGYYFANNCLKKRPYCYHAIDTNFLGINDPISQTALLSAISFVVEYAQII